MKTRTINKLRNWSRGLLAGALVAGYGFAGTGTPSLPIYDSTKIKIEEVKAKGYTEYTNSVREARDSFNDLLGNVAETRTVSYNGLDNAYKAFEEASRFSSNYTGANIEVRNESEFNAGDARAMKLLDEARNGYTNSFNVALLSLGLSDVNYDFKDTNAVEIGVSGTDRTNVVEKLDSSLERRVISSAGVFTNSLDDFATRVKIVNEVRKEAGLEPYNFDLINVSEVLEEKYGARLREMEIRMEKKYEKRFCPEINDEEFMKLEEKRVMELTKRVYYPEEAASDDALNVLGKVGLSALLILGIAAVVSAIHDANCRYYNRWLE